MSAKLLNAELEKKIGCMTGMFQMFDRHRLGRGLSRKSNQREEEYEPSSPQMISEYTSRKSSAEHRRVSTESSRSSRTRSNVVKDSIKREPRGVSVKKGKVLEYQDSPRPTLPADFSPSSNFLARLKETPRNLSEAPRLSCDGREISSRTNKSSGIREPPRLSLDSSLHQRSPSVIARLMGLEAMPPGSESQETTTVLPRKKERSRHSSTPAVVSKQKKHNLEQDETVYSLIERRVKELDFLESNKDLRALKHILGTMQVKGQLETNDQLAKLQTITTPPPTPRAFESPIVIVKPAKSINIPEELEGLSGLRKLRTSSSSGTTSRKQAKVEAGDLRDTSGEKKGTPVMQRSPRPQLSPARGTSASPAKTSSPRVQQRKTEPEKKPRTPPARRQSANRQQVEPVSPGTKKNRLKPNRAEKYNQQVSRRDDDDGNVGLTASGDADDCSMKLNSQKKFLPIAEDISTVESTVLPSEQPSPISVLDASFYYDELSLSPVKTISTGLKDDEIQISKEDYKIPKSPCETSTPKPSRGIVDSWKLGNIKSLVQKLKQLSSTNDESQEPVLDYVLEILLASGVQGETTLAKAKPEKLRHKLMLDVVQEVLIHKLESISPSPQWDARKLGGQLLLRELCSEMKWLLAERPPRMSLEKEEAMSAVDLLPRSQGWEDFGLEVPGLVLEIERSIFKDLIDEVVTGEANYNSLSRRRRQLFT